MLSSTLSRCWSRKLATSAPVLELRQHGLFGRGDLRDGLDGRTDEAVLVAPGGVGRDFDSVALTNCLAPACRYKDDRLDGRSFVGQGAEQDGGCPFLDLRVGREHQIDDRPRVG